MYNGSINEIQPELAIKAEKEKKGRIDTTTNGRLPKNLIVPIARSLYCIRVFLSFHLIFITYS